MPLLYKEYKPGRLRDLDTQTLERFPVFARSLEANSLAWLYERASWPIWIVEDDQAEADRADVGVLMPLATDRFMADLRRPSGGRRRVPAKFELLLNGRRFLDNVGLAISLRQRLELLAAVADTMAFLHAHSIAVGDFSCTNLLFSLTPRPACFFLDCDSMSWGGRTALPAGETPEWELPAGEALATTAGDVYKFALLVLRMHTGAQHHRDATRLPADTWPPLRAQVERTLSSPPHQRPLITDWTGPLHAAAAAASSTIPELPPEPSPITRRGRGPAGTAVAGGSRPVYSAALASNGPPQPAYPVSSGRAAGRTDRLVFWAMRMLRRLLWRRTAPPTVPKMIGMLVGLWTACAVAFGLAWLAGMDPSHLTSGDELGLFGSFVAFAVIAFGFGTTEPR